MAISRRLFEGRSSLKTGRVQRHVTPNSADLPDRRRSLPIDHDVQSTGIAGRQTQSRPIRHGIGITCTQRAGHHRDAIGRLNLYPTVLARAQCDVTCRSRRGRGSRESGWFRRRILFFILSAGVRRLRRARRRAYGSRRLSRAWCNSRWRWACWDRRSDAGWWWVGRNWWRRRFRCRNRRNDERWFWLRNHRRR